MYCQDFTSSKTFSICYATACSPLTLLCIFVAVRMASSPDDDIYDEIEIEDMNFDPTLQIYHYPCPCGDRFEIAIASLRDGEEIAVCPGCSLMIRVIFDVVSFSCAAQLGLRCSGLIMAFVQDDLPKEDNETINPTPAAVAVEA